MHTMRILIAYTEIEEQAWIVNYRFLAGGDLYFEKGEDTFKEDSIMWADSTVFKVFTIPFIAMKNWLQNFT